MFRVQLHLKILPTVPWFLVGMVSAAKCDKTAGSIKIDFFFFFLEKRREGREGKGKEMGRRGGKRQKAKRQTQKREFELSISQRQPPHSSSCLSPAPSLIHIHSVNLSSQRHHILPSSTGL